MHSKVKLLVVDDDEGLRAGLFDLLSLYGFEVLTAGNATQALELLEREVPDLILSDILMPGLSGEEFYVRVRERAEWRGIPFVFLTARPENGAHVNGDLTAEDFIQKPFEPRELAELVLERLARGEG
jgi:DNA-binding response OmpR family regulator